MSYAQEREIGRVPVDSGTISIGDPCYLIPGKGERRQVSWEEVCETFYDQKTLKANPGIEGTREAHEIQSHIMVSTPHGDGEYPVYARVNDAGQVTELRIDLDPPDEED